MTAAIAHLTRPRLRASSRGRPVHILTVLALVLPVPFCAALGLSLPLPATVARIAAKLVPFANSAVLDAKQEQFIGARGSIVRVVGKTAGNAGSATDPAGSLTAQSARTTGVAPTSGDRVDGSRTPGPTEIATTTVAAERGSSAAPLQTNPNADPTSGGGSASAPDTRSTPPPPPPPPPSATPTVVDTATAAAATVVGTAANTVTTATSTVAATVPAAPGVVKGAVGPLLPPKP